MKKLHKKLVKKLPRDLSRLLTGRMMKTLLVMSMVFDFALIAMAAEPGSSVAPPKVKYQAAKDVNFEELLIQGQIRRPEISVVTGNTQQGADGLLRLRDNFTDRIQMDAGEEL